VKLLLFIAFPWRPDKAGHPAGALKKRLLFEWLAVSFVSLAWRLPYRHQTPLAQSH
jgi:hypothetical protein